MSQQGETTYVMGVDLGTTYTAAAVYRGGTPEVATLGHRATVVPSAVFVPSEGEVLVGASALRRGMTQPERLAREFKRRLGDSVPLIVGGSPWSAEALTARLLRWVVHTVSEQEGRPPANVVVTYPANWGEFKQDRLRQALRMAEVEGVTTLTEPEAAAISYARAERVPVGQVITVYDLGGGTFDAAVLRKTSTGFELLGSPEGVERLGGIDIDEAVFSHVRTSLGARFDDLDSEDPTTAVAVARLRADCVDAKEALSPDTQASVPVVLPGLHTEVRLTRTELEDMAHPLLEESMAALRRAIDSAGLTPGEVDRVLLVGGASRMPLVGRLVSETLGRPFFVDANPKHAVALGAALQASDVGQRPATQVPVEVPPDDPLPAPAPAGAGTAPQAFSPTESVPSGPPLLGALPAGAAGAQAPPGRAPAPAPSPVGGTPVPSTAPARPSRSRLGPGLAVAAVVVVLVLVAVLLARPLDEGTDPTAEPGTTTTPPEGNGSPTGDPTLELTASGEAREAQTLAVSDDEVWVATGFEGALTQFDTELDSSEAFGLDRGWYVSGLLAAYDSIWVVASRTVEGDVYLNENELQRRAPETGTVIETFPLGPMDGDVRGLAAGSDSIWLLGRRWSEDTGQSEDTVARVDVQGAGTEPAIVDLPGFNAWDITANDERVWVSLTELTDEGESSSDASIAVIDPATNAVSDDDAIQLGPGLVSDLVWAPSGLWAIRQPDDPGALNRVVQFDPSTGEQVNESLGGDNRVTLRIATAEDWIWLWTAPNGLDPAEGDQDEYLVLFDPTEATAVDRLRIPPSDPDDEGSMGILPSVVARGETAWFTFGSEVHRVEITR